MALPGDPVLLLSVVNLKLRDCYPTLDALCDDLAADKAELCAKLSASTNTEAAFEEAMPNAQRSPKNNIRIFII